MLMQILIHTPAWVWGLFTALLALGLWQRRSRHVAPAALLALPLVMLALGLWTMAPGFTKLPLTAAVWLLALGTGLLLGRRIPAPRGTQWVPNLRRLRLPGSWLPLALILTIFCLRYAAGVSLALHPEWYEWLALQAGMAMAFGSLSGVFLGRALGLRALARRPPLTMAGHATAQAA